MSSSILVSLVVGLICLGLGVDAAAVNKRLQPVSGVSVDVDTPAAGTSQWKWSTCLGTQPTYQVNLVGTSNRHAVVSGPQNSIYIVDLENGTLLANKTLPLLPSDSALYVVSEQELLLQLNYASIVAWSVPDLTQKWSELTYRNSGTGAIFSSTGAFFCLWLLIPRHNYLSAPVCIRSTDGSTLWSGMSNQSYFSSVQHELLEWGGVLVVVTRTQATAVELASGNALWTINFTTIVSTLVASHGLVIISNVLEDGTWAVDIHTGAVVWNQTAITLQLPGAGTSNGLFVTASGAIYISNGSTVWTMAEGLYCNGFFLSVPDHPTKDHEGQFLCSTFLQAGLNYTVGNILTGKVSRPNVVLTPSGDALFGSRAGFFLLGAHPEGSNLDRYCVDALNIGEHP